MARPRPPYRMFKSLVVARRFFDYLKEIEEHGCVDVQHLRTYYQSYRGLSRENEKETKGISFSSVAGAIRRGLVEGILEYGSVFFVGTYDAAIAYITETEERETAIKQPPTIGGDMCRLCQRQVNGMEQHRNTVRHKRQEMLRRAAHERLRDMDAVSEVLVTSDPPAEEGAQGAATVLQERGKGGSLVFTLTNKSKAALKLCRWQLIWRSDYFTLSPSTNQVASRNIVLKPGGSKRLEVVCRPSQEYTTQTTQVLFELTDEAGEGRILLQRAVRANVRGAAHEELKPSTPFKQRRQRRVFAGAHHRFNFVPGFPLPLREDGLKMKRLEQYPVPDAIRLDLNTKPDAPEGAAEEEVVALTSGVPVSSSRPGEGQERTEVVRRERQLISFDNTGQGLREMLAAPLEMTNYASRWDALLWVEECQMEIDIHFYDRDTKLYKVDRTERFPYPTGGWAMLEMKVEGLAEHRPSLLKGDHVFISEKDGGPRYQGVIHKVKQDSVILGFNISFPYIDNQKYAVEFAFNRFPSRLAHRAVHLALQPSLDKLLFPRLGQDYTVTPLTGRVFNRDLGSNAEQMAAVARVVAPATQLPGVHVIFGPPGTGKTSTLVECIAQVLKRDPEARVLACAPENVAADLVGERVLPHLDTVSALLRLYAPSRNDKAIHKLLREKKVTNFEDGRGIHFPPLEELKKKRLIICTVVTAGRLVSGHMPRGHFSHIFIDEAGHTTEPELMIAVAGLCEPGKTRVVLAGDPRQLGPVVRSPLAQENGLAVSLLERLMPGGSSSASALLKPHVTMLKQNYRSHPDIMAVPNKLFYAGELEPRANPDQTERFLDWEELPNKKVPIVFHPVYGRSQREGDSPSFFNVEEAETVGDYLRKLMGPGGPKGAAVRKLSPDQIGIISPYRKQVEKIKKLLNKLKQSGLKDVEKIKVGPVEEFQGQERTVIIISTVRCPTEDFVKMDLDYRLGFLKSPKRFNVAVTRAKALLIVVGHDKILQHDDSWRSFLDFCGEKGAVRKVDVEASSGCEDAANRCRDILASTCRPILPENEEDIAQPDMSLRQQVEEPEMRRND